MKKNFLLVLLTATVAFSFAQQSTTSTKAGIQDKKEDKAAASNPNAPKLLFPEDTYNFGEVSEGPQVTHEFKFTNTGKEPLVLSNVKASCGCTTPSWPKEPILPGKES